MATVMEEYLTNLLGKSEDELVTEFCACNEEGKERIYLTILFALQKVILQSDTDILKKISLIFNIFKNEISEGLLLKFYENINNPFKITNPVILCCKQGNVEIIKLLFEEHGAFCNLLPKNSNEFNINPTDVDEDCHNAFYYAMRSGKTELLQYLINSWPGISEQDLDKILSDAYNELRLRNVAVPIEMHVVIRYHLIKQRFFNQTGDKSRVSVRMNDFHTFVEERINVLLEDIKELAKLSNVDEVFLTQSKIHNCALSADAEENEGKLTITRALQVIGEHIKNTLETPKLSDATGKLLLYSLPISTRDVIVDLRNALSHAESLAKRSELKQNNEYFFSKIQNDFIKLHSLVSEILCKIKTRVIVALLNKIFECTSIEDMKETISCFNLIEANEAFSRSPVSEELEQLENFMQDLRVAFNAIYRVLTKLKDSKNNETDIEFIKNNVDQSLLTVNMMTAKLDQSRIQEVGSLLKCILINVGPRMSWEDLDEVTGIAMKVFYIPEYELFDRQPQFLENNPPTLIGKNLRNHLAHFNAVNDVLEVDVFLDTILNAWKLVAEVTMAQSEKIDKVVQNVHLKETFQHHLDKIIKQKELYSALVKGDNSTITNCLRTGADLHGRDLNLWTALHFASKGPCLEVVKYVLSKNIDIGAKDVSGMNSLHVASYFGRADIVEFFLKDQNMSPNEETSDGMTPLDLAIGHDHKNVVETLLKNNASIQLKRGSHAPMRYAIWYNRKDIVEIILGKEWNIDASVTMGGFTSLHIAAERGHTDLVNFLLTKNANVRSKSDERYEPLHLASMNGEADIVRSLLSKGADSNAETLDGRTPLSFAAEMGRTTISELLVEHKANVNVADKTTQYSPLILSVKTGNLAMVKFCWGIKHVSMHKTSWDRLLYILQP
ncbi:hypothetical protein CEXT_536251 [Caerostris extrusa]|uniref:Alpha-latrotoxin n=1 Tax=Caerostris extrusa TaxID=172846 RepID=A0AAV4SKY0_CAEEX|nr:hypothetical protein CEXT_536251 [Caerostris extrusa]